MVYITNALAKSGESRGIGLRFLIIPSCLTRDHFDIVMICSHFYS